jgi:HAD superfamily hydrolase (TIGR01490 family)
MSSKKFAVFDIDGTLIRWQLYHVMVDKLAGAGALGPDAKQRLREARMNWKRRKHEDSFKEYERLIVQLYESALDHLNTKDFDQFITDIIDEYKDQAYVYTRNLLQDLKKKGYFTLIISGSHHELIEQVGKYYGFDDWIGTHYRRTGESFSGEKQVASKDKAAALKQFVDKHGLTFEGSLAIGDSASDIAMLELVEQPIAFNPDKILFEQAKEKGWPVVVERKNMIYELRAKDGTYVLD